MYCKKTLEFCEFFVKFRRICLIGHILLNSFFKLALYFETACLEHKVAICFGLFLFHEKFYSVLHFTKHVLVKVLYICDYTFVKKVFSCSILPNIKFRKKSIFEMYFLFSFLPDMVCVLHCHASLMYNRF